MEFSELVNAVNNDVPLVWVDPDPIEDTDYTITSISLDYDSEKEIVMIEYGNGSEAEVHIDEIKYK